ncbi:hypothetical protein BCR34DRAFT_587848 [Clohesyomyces aquaticus]|uniref:Uncharacterized protein n=1 Tax=Clohesyomyces aquaticus TaxID=1231657 RepID=A0A1Y1ZNW0_9PLEO|nr:hypothetical protein BCR34DRAFT_587848 [Clohesyomyces aquaticus]
MPETNIFRTIVMAAAAIKTLIDKAREPAQKCSLSRPTDASSRCKPASKHSLERKAQSVGGLSGHRMSAELALHLIPTRLRARSCIGASHLTATRSAPSSRRGMVGSNNGFHRSSFSHWWDPDSSKALPTTLSSALLVSSRTMPQPRAPCPG